MHLNEIFTKDVQRPIQGVIKADDDAHLRNEVEEYVLTNEVTRELSQLLDAYTKYSGANGVWISGFFGSGKSHLLKMLAHLLGEVRGHDVQREEVSASFREKGAAEDGFLEAALATAEGIPARSLLFNIDQKASLISKDQKDALLRVFVTVFNEARGYYGGQPHVARFERDLDRRSQLQEFKDTYRQIAGRPWETGREEGVLEEQNIAEAYARVSGSENTNILAKYRSEYSVSIEDFAEEVSQWLQEQEPKFRLNFFVDEVGQFIGENTHLMLNLQTIAESLNTRCQGRAWVFVTSQEDMDKVIGDRTKQQGNDFSKIRDRFSNRVKLSSADVEEVIRKRLLEKNAQGTEVLQQIHSQEHANFRTIFEFTDGAKTYRNYTSPEQFIGTYPFVSYQFPLFQSAMQGLSEHNVFEGRHSSVGERSMLGVVQEVTKDIGTLEVGQLATFDQMFAGIRASLKSLAQRSIDTAEKHLGNSLAVRLLKALFLVKFVEDFRSTARNLSVLVYERFDQDPAELTENVEHALELLERETYIQRNGDQYEYLTNEEQLVEQEIKNVDIDNSEVIGSLGGIFTQDLMRTTKLTYAKNQQSFLVGFMVDDRPVGRVQALTLHLISPMYEYDRDIVVQHSAGKDELRIIMEADPRLLGDLRLLLQTERYVKQQTHSDASPAKRRILQDKQGLNGERRKTLVDRVAQSLGKAELVVNASVLESRTTAASDRIHEGFQELVARTYTQLNLLGGITYGEQQISQYVSPPETLSEDPEARQRLAAPAEEVLNHVRRSEQRSEELTVHHVVEKFSDKPYGWDLGSILVMLAHLVGQSSIALSSDGSAIARTEVVQVLRNDARRRTARVHVQKSYDPQNVSRLKQFCKDFFDDPTVPRDAQDLARHTKQELALTQQKLRDVMTGSQYPFVSQLQEPADLLAQVSEHPEEWFLTEFDQADELMELKEDLIDPILSFVNGSRAKIWADAQQLLHANASNLSYIEYDTAPLTESLQDPGVFRGNRATRLKQMGDELRSAVEQAVQAHQDEAAQRLEDRRQGLQEDRTFLQATESAQRAALSKVDSALRDITASQHVAAIESAVNRFEEQLYPALLDQLDASAAPAPAPMGSGEAPAPVKVPTSTSIRSIKPSGGPAVLENSEDVEQYLDALRSKLLNVIESGKRIVR